MSRPTLSQFGEFFEGATDSDVRRDILLLSYLLSGVQVGRALDFVEAGGSYSGMSGRRPSRPPYKAELDAWTYLASILTTGTVRAGGEEDNPSASGRDSGNMVQVAVTGELESDTITAAVVAPDVSRGSAHGRETFNFSVSELQSEKTGLEVLTEHYRTSMDVTLSEHAADVFAILNYLFAPITVAPIPDSNVVISRRVYTFTIFISRRCYRKLRARIDRGANMWTKHPLELLHSWYHDSERDRPLSKQFLLPPGLREWLVPYDLHPDEAGVPAKDGNLMYTVSQDTAVSWVDMLYGFLGTMREMYCRSDEWKADRVAALYMAMVILHYTATSGVLGHLVTPGLAHDLSEKFRSSAQSRRAALEEAITNPSCDIDAAPSAYGDDLYELPHDTPTITGEACRASVVRHLRSLCVAYAATDFYVRYGLRMADRGIRIQCYMISSKPSIPQITAATVREFSCKFRERFQFPEEDIDVVTDAFEKLAGPLERQPFEAAEHAEATLMALACSSQSDGGAIHAMDSSLETPSTKRVQSMFQALPWVPIGSSKKACCFCCYKLATLLQDSDWERPQLKFVLEGTHSVIVPWVPPEGLPTEILVQIRLSLVQVLYDTVADTVGTLRPAPPPRTDSVSYSGPIEIAPPELLLAARLHLRIPHVTMD